MVSSLVEHLGFGVLLWRANCSFVARDDLIDFAVGIIEIANGDCLGWAHDLARRLQAYLDPVVAHIAFVCRIGLGVDVERIVGAGIHARLASDAVVVLEVNDTVVGPEERIRRAYRHTRCVLALVATHHRKFACNVGERARLDVLDPRPVHPQRHVVFTLAGDGAGMAANAVVAVEHKAQSCHGVHVTIVTPAWLEA